jgi:hypothetical protein
MNNILIPELNILTNDSDLRSKQKKVLAYIFITTVLTTSSKSKAQIKKDNLLLMFKFRITGS